MSKQGPRQLHNPDARPIPLAPPLEVSTGVVLPLSHATTAPVATSHVSACMHVPQTTFVANCNHLPACSHANNPPPACSHAKLSACPHASNSQSLHANNPIPSHAINPTHDDNPAPVEQSVPVCEAPQCTTPGMSRCTRCKVTYYCSRSCQATHWKVHKLVCSLPGTMAPTPTTHSNTGSNAPKPSTVNPTSHQCIAPHCSQRAHIPCEDCESSLYCSTKCMHSDAISHAQICRTIRDIRVHRRWSHLRAVGWEQYQILKLVDRFAVPAPTAAERFDIMYEEEFFRQLAKDAVVYTGLPQEHIHQLAVESTPEELSRLGKELHRKKQEYELKHRPKPRKRWPPIGRLKKARAKSHRNPGTQPLPMEAPNPSPQVTNEIDNLSPPQADIVLQQEDSTEPDSEQATESRSTKTDETPDPVPPNHPVVSMVPVPSQDSMETRLTRSDTQSVLHRVISVAARRKKKRAPKKQYCKKKIAPCLYFPPYSPKSRLGLCNRQTVFRCIYCKWSSLIIPLPRCGVG